MKILSFKLNRKFKPAYIVACFSKYSKSDGSSVYVHYVDGVKIATLYCNKDGQVVDIEVEDRLQTRGVSSYVDCVSEKYGELKKGMEGSFMDIITDAMGPVKTIALAATAAADCSGMFDYIGIK